MSGSDISEKVERQLAEIVRQNDIEFSDAELHELRAQLDAFHQRVERVRAFDIDRSEEPALFLSPRSTGDRE